jgi:hypothetical protein
MRSNRDFNFAVTTGAPAFIGVAVFIDIDAAIHLATFEQNADKFFISLWIHVPAMIETAISRRSR